MKPTTHSMARAVEDPQEIEPVASDYMPEPVDGRARRHSDWLWLLWERRGLLSSATVRGCILLTVIAFLIPARYESTTRLMPPDSQSGSGLAMMAALMGGGGGQSSQGGQGGIGLASLAGDLLGLKSSGALFTAILHSRTVEDRIIQRFDLRKVYGDKYWEDARKDLENYTEVTEDRKSGIITIAVTDRDRQRAAQMAQAYVEELNRLVAQVSTSSARRERIFIEQRLVGVKQDLDKVAKQFSEYASENTAVDITAQAKASVEAAAVLQGQLIAAQSELEGLEQIYTAHNVRVRSLAARIQELKLQLRKLGGNDSATAANGPDSESEFPSVRELPLLGVRWSDLYRQLKIQETVYELLTRQYELAKIEEAKEIPTVKVLDPADIPERKSRPPRLLIVCLGTLLCLCAASSWIVATALWHQADPGDPRKELANEILGKLKLTFQRWLSQAATLRNRARD